MKVKEESEKVGLKLNIQKTTGPITSWQIDGETVETVTDFILGGSKITAHGDRSHKIKRCLLLGRKGMTNLGNIVKNRDITLPTKVCVSYGFSSSHVWMWELDHKEGWAKRIDAFELWCWRRLLRVLWTARRSNQSIPKEISPEYSLKGLMLKLKLQYLGYLMWRTGKDQLFSLEKTLMLGKIEGRRRRGQLRMRCWMASPTRWTGVRASSRRWWGTGKRDMLKSMRSQGVGHNLATEQQQMI